MNFFIEYGIGYEWQPAVVHIKVGDSVKVNTDPCWIALSILDSLDSLYSRLFIFPVRTI